MSTVAHLQDIGVIELRRYAIHEGQREAFAACFESFFPEAFQQLGAIALGQFLEKDNAGWFTWLRGFRDMDARLSANTAFYGGPLWKEHRTRINDLLIDSDNVLLLEPLDRARRVPVLPAVDPSRQGDGAGAAGIVVAQIFAVEHGGLHEFADEAAEAFAAYVSAGVREAGVLITLDVPNNFPQLPVRTDGPYLVWLGIVENERALEDRFRPLMEELRPALDASRKLRGPTELVVLHPTRRSRLRWLRAS